MFKAISIFYKNNPDILFIRIKEM